MVKSFLGLKDSPGIEKKKEKENTKRNEEMRE